MPIWKYGMNFLHGTGHGVGHFLSVHEGPQSIRMNENLSLIHIWVLALNCLQNSMILIPLEPKAGPTGGDGFAAPPLICNLDVYKRQDI